MTWNQFWGICEHKWVKIQVVNIYNGEDAWVGVKYVLQCDKCGTITVKRI